VARRTFTEKEMMQWALDRLQEVVQEEKRARQEAEATEKKAVKHSQTSAADALTAMKTRSAKIAASSSSGRPTAPAWFQNQGEGLYTLNGMQSTRSLKGAWFQPLNPEM
jgi:hypothetical protein